jgi:hypothetical protein
MIIDRYPIIRSSKPAGKRLNILEAVRRNRPKAVYFARPVGMRGPIKIGCSADARRRVQALRYRGRRCVLLATLHGAFQLEGLLHLQFGRYRLHGEWFAAGKRLVEFVRPLQHEDAA